MYILAYNESHSNGRLKVATKRKVSMDEKNFYTRYLRDVAHITLLFDSLIGCIQ